MFYRFDFKFILHLLYYKFFLNFDLFIEVVYFIDLKELFSVNLVIWKNIEVINKV